MSKSSASEEYRQVIIKDHKGIGMWFLPAFFEYMTSSH